MLRSSGSKPIWSTGRADRERENEIDTPTIKIAILEVRLRKSSKPSSTDAFAEPPRARFTDPRTQAQQAVRYSDMMCFVNFRSAISAPRTI